MGSQPGYCNDTVGILVLMKTRTKSEYINLLKGRFSATIKRCNTIEVTVYQDLFLYVAEGCHYIWLALEYLRYVAIKRYSGSLPIVIWHQRCSPYVRLNPRGGSR
jgi:hypothetical protein